MLHIRSYKCPDILTCEIYNLNNLWCKPLQVAELTKHAKERVELAKALIRASEKPAKARKAKGGTGKDEKDGETAPSAAEAATA